MKIVVCIKQVPDVNAYIEIDSISGRIDEDDIVQMVNPFDKVAVEAAIRIKERFSDTEICLLTVGPERAKRALIDCLSMGPIDKAVHLCDKAFEKLDKYATAMVISKAIEQLGFDMILCGKQSIDDSDGQVGPYIAHFLNIPCVSDIAKLEWVEDKKKILLNRMLEAGDMEELEADLPLLCTAGLLLNTPRYPSFPDSLNALRKEIVRMDGKALTLGSEIRRYKSSLQILEVGFPKPRPKNIKLPDADLPVHARLDFLMSGGLSKKDGELLEGDPKGTAARIAELLVQRNII